MDYEIKYGIDAKAIIDDLANGRRSDQVKLKKIKKTANLLAENPRHPSLRAHEFKPGRAKALHEKYAAEDGKLYTAYVDHRTPNAWRMLWRYGPSKKGCRMLIIEWLGGHY